MKSLLTRLCETFGVGAYSTVVVSYATDGANCPEQRNEFRVELGQLGVSEDGSICVKKCIPREVHQAITAQIWKENDPARKLCAIMDLVNKGVIPWLDAFEYNADYEVINSDNGLTLVDNWDDEPEGFTSEEFNECVERYKKYAPRDKQKRHPKGKRT